MTNEDFEKFGWKVHRWSSATALCQAVTATPTYYAVFTRSGNDWSYTVADKRQTRRAADRLYAKRGGR